MPPVFKTIVNASIWILLMKGVLLVLVTTCGFNYHVILLLCLLLNFIPFVAYNKYSTPIILRHVKIDLNGS